MNTTRLKRRLACVEQAYGPLRIPEPDPRRVRRLQQVTRRLGRLRQAAQRSLTPDDATQVNAAFREALDHHRGPYFGWLRDLWDGCWRLPELSLECMKALLLALLSPECEPYGWVCLTCGLAYPQHRPPPLTEWRLLPGRIPLVGNAPWYDLRVFFATCPYCGTPSHQGMWAHRVREEHYAWMEADGYVGPA